MDKIFKKAIFTFILLVIFLATCTLLHRELSRIFAAESLHNGTRYVLNIHPNINNNTLIQENIFLKPVIIDVGKDFAATQLATNLPIPSILIFAPNTNNAIYWMQNSHNNGHSAMLAIAIKEEGDYSLSDNAAEYEANLQELLENIPEYVGLYINDQSTDSLLESTISSALLGANRKIYTSNDYINNLNTNIIDNNNFSITTLAEANNIAKENNGLMIMLKADYKSMSILQEWINQSLSKE